MQTLIVKPIEFRISFTRLLFAVVVPTLLMYSFLATLLTLLQCEKEAFVEQFLDRLPDYASHIFLLLLIDALSIWAYTAMRVVCISPECLRGSDIWTSKFFNTTWESITEVKPASILWLHFLKIRSTETRRMIWLPLFLEDVEHFVDMTSQFAGPEHPVTKELRRVKGEE